MMTQYVRNAGIVFSALILLLGREQITSAGDIIVPAQIEEVIEVQKAARSTVQIKEAREAVERAVQGRSTRQKTNEKKPNVDPESLPSLQKRHADIQTEIARLKNQPAPAAPKTDELVIVFENPHFTQGRYRSNNQYDRAFAVRMLIGNPTKKEITLKRTDVSLKSADKTYKAEQSASRYYSSFNVGKKSYSISSLRMKDELKIPAGKSASTWALFNAFPMSPAVPDLKLTVQVGDEKREIDLNEYFEALLKTNIERLGPEKCLAILTVTGKLNPVNVENLVNQMEDLTVKKKLARIILRWDKDAPPIDTNLLNWLQQMANQAGLMQVNNQNNNHNPYPIVPQSIRELHIAERPKENGSYSSSSDIRVHKTTGEAVVAALRTAYLALTADQIVDDLRNPNPIIRAAALSGGGGRLPPEKLPVLLGFLESKERSLQRAAIFALRHFGEEDAIKTLVKLVQKNEQPVSTEAAESLATSRFHAASKALLELLKTAEPDVKKTIVEVLAKYPRPVWGEVIAEFAKDPESPIGMAALRALVQIGHDDLNALLKNAIDSTDATVQMNAFNILAGRRDPESEQLAMDFMLTYLRSNSLTGQMPSLIARTKDRRVVPLLLKQFRTRKQNRYNLISTLSQVGGQEVVDELVAQFPKMNNSDKRNTLEALERLHAPEYVQIAAQCLTINDSSLLNRACDGLYKDGGLAAEQALIEALKKDVKTSYWRYVCNALTNFGTPQARQALRGARNSKDSNKKSAAISALRNLQQRSPGNQFIYQARSYVTQKKWKEAISSFDLAIEADPEFAEAYAGRGIARLQLGKIKEAEQDFEEAIEADPEHTQAHMAKALALVMKGKVDEGIKSAEESRKVVEPFESNKGLLAFLVARVYARGAEEVGKKTQDDATKKKQTELTEKALKELASAIKLGYRNYAEIQKDEFLKSLHGKKEYNDLFPKGNKPKPDEKTKKAKKEVAKEAAADAAEAAAAAQAGCEEVAEE